MERSCEAASMFIRPEDNETQAGRRPHQAAVQAAAADAPAVAAGSVTGPAGVAMPLATTPARSTAPFATPPTLTPTASPLISLYPKLDGLSPPPYTGLMPPKPSTPRVTRSQTRALRPDLDNTEQYPLIQVTNPNPVDQGPAHLYVYRPWTLEEARKAVKGCTPAKEDPAQWAEDMQGVILLYRLNGHEAGQAAMTSLGKDWARVRGDYTGRSNGGEVLPAPQAEPAVLAGDYLIQWTALVRRVEAAFRRRADYGCLAGVKQKTGEDVEDFHLRFEKEFRVHSGIDFNAEERSAYQQQLKNGLLTGFRPEIGNWVRKHHVESADSTVSQTMQWARHAEKVVHEKGGKKGGGGSSDVFNINDFESSNSTAFFHGGQRGGGRGRDRGRGRGQRPFQSGRDRNSEECWNCGKCGHWSRDCPKKKQDNYRRGGRGRGRPNF